MLSISPGHSPDRVIAVLRAAANAAGNANTTSPNNESVLLAYRRWVTAHAPLVGLVLSPASADEILSTPTYWLLQSLDAAAYGVSTGQLVRNELVERQGALTAAADEVAKWLVTWQHRAAVVLDTNVLLRHHQELATFDWIGAIDWRSRAIALAVPIVVVEELDRLKRVDQKMKDATGVDVKTSTLARAALDTLDWTFELSLGAQPLQTFDLTPEGTMQPGVTISLLVPDLQHRRRERNDAEVISNALELLPFAESVTILTGDRAMAFEARTTGLLAALVDQNN
jgi:hypothetical protein